MKKKTFYLIMTLFTLLSSQAIVFTLFAIMPCNKANLVVIGCLSMALTLLTLLYWDSFTKAKS